MEIHACTHTLYYADKSMALSSVSFRLASTRILKAWKRSPSKKAGTFLLLEYRMKLGAMMTLEKVTSSQLFCGYAMILERYDDLYLLLCASYTEK